VRQLDKAGARSDKAGLGRDGYPSFAFLWLLFTFALYYECTMHILGHTFSAPPPTTSGVSHSSCLSLMTNFCMGEIFLGFLGRMESLWRISGAYLFPEGVGYFIIFSCMHTRKSNRPLAM
jgi:hypothetical protein